MFKDLEIDYKKYHEIFIKNTLSESFSAITTLNSLFEKLSHDKITYYEKILLKLMLNNIFIGVGESALEYGVDSNSVFIKNKGRIFEDDEYALEEFSKAFKEIYKNFDENLREYTSRNFKNEYNTDVIRFKITDGNSEGYNDINRVIYINECLALYQNDDTFELLKFDSFPPNNITVHPVNSIKRMNDVTGSESFGGNVFSDPLTQEFSKNNNMLEEYSPILDKIIDSDKTMTLLMNLILVKNNSRHGQFTRMINFLSTLDTAKFYKMFQWSFYNDIEKFKGGEELSIYLYDSTPYGPLYNNYIIHRALERGEEFAKIFIKYYSNDITSGGDPMIAAMKDSDPYGKLSVYLDLVENFKVEDNIPIEWWLELKNSH